MAHGRPEDEPSEAAAVGGDEYRRFYRQSGVPTLTLDVEQRAILDCNQAMLDLLACERADIIGRPAAELLAEPTPDEALRVLALRGESARTIRKVTTGHGLRIAEISMVPSGVDGVVFVQAHDVTDLLEANTMLEQRSRELQAKTDSLESLAARMAHDLRGPLATIGGFVDLLRNNSAALPEDQHGAVLERISANVASLAGMVADMLDETMRSGDDVDDGGSVAVADLFASLRSIFDVELFAVDGRLETSTEVDQLPVPVGRIRQILVNLVGNSLKFCDPRRPLEVSVTVVGDDDTTVITVRDNGSGIDGDPEALFDEGVRGDDVSDVDGSGLGLAHSRSAAEALGGTLVAQPSEIGATFELRLPQVPETADLASPFGGNYAGGLTARQLDLVLQLSPTPTLLIDLAARGVVRVNRAAEELLGVPVKEILGKRAREFLADPAEGDSLRADVLLEGRGRAGTVTNLRTAEGLVPVVVELAAIPNTTLSVAQFHRVHYGRRSTERAADPDPTSTSAPRSGDNA